MTDLKYCPHCGNAVTFVYDLDGIPNGIACMRCRIVTRFLRERLKPKEKIGDLQIRMAEVWNRKVSNERPD